MKGEGIQQFLKKLAIKGFLTAILCPALSWIALAAAPIGSPASPQEAPSGNSTCTDNDVQDLMASVFVPLTSRVYVTGPYVGGTLLVEDGSSSPVILKVGSTEGSGSYRVYWIDDAVDSRLPRDEPFPPSIKFKHSTRFAWTNQQNFYDYGVAQANDSLTVYPYPFGSPGRDFTPLAFQTVNGVPVQFGFGEFAAQITQKLGSQLQEEVLDAPANNGCLYRSLVIDGGAEYKRVKADGAKDMATDADDMADWLRRSSFGRMRVSQYWRNLNPAYPKGNERAAFLADIRHFENLFKDVAVGQGCHHEFFLYIASHGNKDNDGSFYPYDSDGNGASEGVPYNELFDALNRFPSDPQHLTTVYVMIDTCYAGLAVPASERFAVANGQAAGHWALQVVTAVDNDHEAAVGHVIFLSDSATEDFLKNPTSMTVGYKEMVDDAHGRNPQRRRAPDQAGAKSYYLDR